jgi:small-conductance mechanosensitive channel
LLNLVLTIVAAAVAVLLLAARRKRGGEDAYGDGENESDGKGNAFWILALAATAVSAVLLLLTQDLSQPMRLLDKWTIGHVVITAVTVVAALLSRGNREEEDDYAE